MFKDSPEGQTYSCQEHIWDSEELNPRCHVCGLLMRDDSLQKESEWESEFESRFHTTNNDYDGGKMLWVQKEEVKSFLKEIISNREKEIAEEVEKFMPADREVNYHSSYSEGKIDMAEKVLQIVKH